jgi:hypothetical protein
MKFVSYFIDFWKNDPLKKQPQKNTDLIESYKFYLKHVLI